MAKSDRPDLPKPGSTLELVCLKNSFDIIRSRLPPAGATVIVRVGVSEVRPVPGEIFTVEVERPWVFGHTVYLKGRHRPGSCSTRWTSYRKATRTWTLPSFVARKPSLASPAPAVVRVG